MEQYLFLVSIGPVQTFIASARRTRDLKFGSELLSELSKVAAKKISEQYGIESLIFPAPVNLKLLEPKTDFNVANKIVAVIYGSPKDLGKDVYESIRTRLLKFRDEAKGFLELPDSYRAAAYAQLDDLVEYFWAALPFEQGQYNATRENIEALIAARKNTRDFEPVTWSSNQFKSSIDGQLESVIPNDLYPHNWEKPGIQRRKARELYDNFHANIGEHLSGVDLLKRNGPLAEDSFPSTSHFATLPFLQRLEALDSDSVAQLKRFWDIYIEKIRAVPARVECIPKSSPPHNIIGNCEGSMLLEERFSDLVDINDDMSKFEGAKNALHEFFQQVDKLFPGASPRVRPGPYYAILLADGDSMGKVIDHQATGVDGMIQHRVLSKALANFSGKVRTIVEGNKNHKGPHGSLIYAGGDDVLAFLPLHTVLQCAQELATEFKEQLQSFTSKEGKSPTLSVGVAIVHHLQPLREALELARDAEKKAKHVEGKNALAITISKRSGGDFTIAGKWKNTDTNLPDFAERLNELIRFCRAEAIPEGTAYELRDLALRLAVPAQVDAPVSHTMQAVIKADAKRILQRKFTHLSKNKSRTDDDDESTLREQRIIAILEKAESVEHFANELIAAQFFADSMELAQLPKGIPQ